jgi:hypothetical protein
VGQLTLGYRIKKEMLADEAIYDFKSMESSQTLVRPAEETAVADDVDGPTPVTAEESAPADSDSDTSLKGRGRRKPKKKRQATPELVPPPIDDLGIAESETNESTPPVQVEEAAPQPSKKDKRRAKEAAKKAAVSQPAQQVRGGFQLLSSRPSHAGLQRLRRHLRQSDEALRPHSSDGACTGWAGEEGQVQEAVMRRWRLPVWLSFACWTFAAFQASDTHRRG